MMRTKFKIFNPKRKNAFKIITIAVFALFKRPKKKTTFSDFRDTYWFTFKTISNH